MHTVCSGAESKKQYICHTFEFTGSVYIHLMCKPEWVLFTTHKTKPSSSVDTCTAVLSSFNFACCLYFYVQKNKQTETASTTNIFFTIWDVTVC